MSLHKPKAVCVLQVSGNAPQQVETFKYLWSCEVDKHSSGLRFSRKSILDVLCRQGDLVYGRPPVSKVRLLPREQWVDDWVDTSADESLQDFKRDTHQRYGTVALWVPDDFFWVRDRNYLLLSRSLEF